jgi:hypothetical protein
MSRDPITIPGPSTEGRVDHGGRPSVVTLEQRGKLLVALACGLSQREAAIWAGTTQKNISYLLRHDHDFPTELRDDTRRARFHPQLRLYQAAGESWTAAAALIEHLEACHGRYSTDELIDSMRLMLELALGFERLEISEPDPFLTMPPPAAEGRRS